MFRVNNISGCRSGVFIVNFENISQHFTPFSSFSIIDFEQVNVSWVIIGRVYYMNLLLF